MIRRYLTRGRHRPGRGRVSLPLLLAVLALQAGALVPMAAAVPAPESHQATGQRDLCRSLVTTVAIGAWALVLAYGLAAVGMLVP